MLFQGGCCGCASQLPFRDKVRPRAGTYHTVRCLSSLYLGQMPGTRCRQSKSSHHSICQSYALDRCFIPDVHTPSFKYCFTTGYHRQLVFYFLTVTRASLFSLARSPNLSQNSILGSLVPITILGAKYCIYQDPFNSS